MVLAVAAPPSKRRRLDSFHSDSERDDDVDDDDERDDEDNDSESSSRSPSPAAGAHAIAHMISSQRHPSTKTKTTGAIDPSLDDTPSASSSAKHRCDICSKTFARHEHMLRHRASHTDSASFSCEDCGKRFRRSDVLQRHRRLHVTRKELNLDESNTKLTKRQRSALARVEAACLRCSSKKLKCDAAKPSCARCRRLPDTACVYPAHSDTAPSSPTHNVDDAWGNDPPLASFAAHTDSPPIASSTPYPAQASTASPATFAQQPPSLLDTHFSASSISSSTPVDLQPQSLLSAPPANYIPATHSLTHMLHAPPPTVDANAANAQRTLHDLIGWLDGPLVQERPDPEKIDWIFGDSPEAPQLLDWAQMYEWADFDLAARPNALAPSSSDALSALPSFEQPQAQPQNTLTPHHRHLSNATPIQQNSPLFVLSSAAEMLDFGQRSSQALNDSGAAKTPMPPIGVDEPNRSADALPSDNRAVTTGRSRWNSPEPAEDDLVTSDSARSDPSDSKRGSHSADTAAAFADGLRPGRHAKTSSGRNAAASQAWPNRWNPAIKENSLPSFTFTRASEEHLMAEDMAHVKRIGHGAMVRMVEHLKNAAEGPLEEERFNAAFASLDAATLNVYLQLFFHHCYSYLPAIHQVTFHPDRCDPRLLAALCAVGAFFSEIPGSRNAAIYLASLDQISVSRATLSNNALARVTSTFQSILLVYMIWRSVGVPSRQEYAEAFRSTYCTMIRRARLLENIAPPKLPARATIDERWTAWIAWESGRRTAWSTLVSETELSVHWNLPEAFAPNEITGKLPCDDRLWEAPTAIEWMQTAKMLAPPLRGLQPGAGDGMPSIVVDEADEHFVWPDSSSQLDVATACDIIQRYAQASPNDAVASVTEEEREALARLSPFSRLCVGSAVMLSTHHTMKMVRFCPMLLGDEEQARERMRNYLGAATDLLSTNQVRDARVDLLLHAIQLFELISPEMLQLLSCRRGVPRMQAARNELSAQLNQAKPWKTRCIVFHAGQMLRLAKQSLQRAPVECLHIFYAAIALQAVSLLVLQNSAGAPSGTIYRIAFNGPARSAVSQGTADAGSTRVWRSGSSASIASSTSPSSAGAYSSAATSINSMDAADARSAPTTFMLESVGNLAHPLAPERILSLASKWLRADDGVGVWPIGQSLAKILDSLAALTPRRTDAT
ncbi:FOG: Zn-finger [Moesziomyces antarcticus T-34]|uniref:FOG: Zn-finger n=1 Tax=Pseudozyma antarctica (strain T-34) TaxID=1151754 RepID=M9MC40_PSEA3|nr:FOG: Zn-finger [Moesziomyces antarcticus T-34]